MNFLFIHGFNFIIYSFIGWILENSYCYYLLRRFQDDGFLNGPYKPMYGFAFTILTIGHELSNKNIIVTALLCLIVPTIIEYITGYVLKVAFNKIYWDYSESRYNYGGLICMEFSFYWFILSFIGIYFIHPLICKLFLFYSKISNIFIPLIILLIAIDFVLTIISIADIKKIIANLNLSNKYNIQKKK